MSRRKISTEEGPSFKLYTTLNSKTKSLLDAACKGLNMKYTKFINYMLHTIYSSSPEVKAVVVDCLKSQIDNINNQFDSVGEAEAARLLSLKQEYLDLYHLFNVHNVKNNSIDDLSMASIEIRNGDIVKFPKRWLIANPEEATSFSYAGVIEGYGIPHIVFFSDDARGNYSNELKEELLNVCYKKWPELKLSMNTTEIKYFPLYDNSTRPRYYEYPCGSRIIRKGEVENL